MWFFFFRWTYKSFIISVWKSVRQWVITVCSHTWQKCPASYSFCLQPLSHVPPKTPTKRKTKTGGMKSQRGRTKYTDTVFHGTNAVHPEHNVLLCSGVLGQTFSEGVGSRKTYVYLFGCWEKQTDDWTQTCKQLMPPVHHPSLLMVHMSLGKCYGVWFLCLCEDLSCGMTTN